MFGLLIRLCRCIYPVMKGLEWDHLFSFKVIRYLPKAILCQQAGVAEVTFFSFPILEAAVVIELHVLRMLVNGKPHVPVKRNAGSAELPADMDRD